MADGVAGTSLQDRVQTGPGESGGGLPKSQPGVSYDDTVNQEDNFEDRIYTVEKEKRLFERIAMEQKEDGVIARALTELSRKGRVMSGQLKNVSDRLKCIEGNLFFEDRIVTPKHLRQETTEVTHTQHHFGQTSTLRTLRKNFFWPKMRRDVIRCCRGCLACQRAKYKTSGREPLCTMSIGSGVPGEAVAMDVGTLPWSDDPNGGYRYVLLMVDLFTRYVELRPLKDQETDTILDAFQMGWVYRGHGMPRIVLTDQGANLDGRTFREFCEKAGIEKRHTTPYHPQCDGMAERNIGLVKQVIRCLQMDRHLEKGSWPMLLTEVSFQMNSMENATTRLSPHLLTFGREPLSPLDSWCKHLKEEESNTHGEYLAKLKQKRAELRDIARENIEANLRSARNRYNTSRTASDTSKGDRVMIKRNQAKDSLSPRFDGPFDVLERKGPNVKLRLTRRDKWVHLDHVKRYEGPAPSLIQATSRGAALEAQLQKANQPGTSYEFDEGEQQASGMEGETVDESNEIASPERRYPERDRRPPQRFKEYVVPWGGDRRDSASTGDSDVESGYT